MHEHVLDSQGNEKGDDSTELRGNQRIWTNPKGGIIPGSYAVNCKNIGIVTHFWLCCFGPGQ